MNIFQHYLAEEFAEDYQEGRLSRREALKMITAITGSVILANSILIACTTPEPTGSVNSPIPAAPTSIPNTPTDEMAVSTGAAATETSPPTTNTPAQEAAVTVSPDSASIEAAEVQFPGEGATLTGYFAKPAGSGPFPVVLVSHENRGLTEHIKDVTRRLAMAGYAALAVDLLSREGGTASLSADQVPGVLGNTNPEQFVKDFQSGLAYLQGMPELQTDRLGMVGFCFGGGVTWLAATKIPELHAAVPFYGPHPPLEDVPGIQAAVLGIYAGNDNRINQGIPEIEQAMLDNQKTFEKIVYPNTDHAFHNDTGARYSPEAAADAWKQTLEWFKKYV